MCKWDASPYLRNGTKRTRAAADLLVRIDSELPQNIVDLGCGPGNSTALLRHRWPDAKLGVFINKGKPRHVVISLQQYLD